MSSTLELKGNGSIKSATVTNLGAALMKLQVMDKDGRERDVVLGFEDVNVDSILNRIHEIEDEFYTYCNDRKNILLLGTPTKLGGTFDSYKARPQNVDAMSLWNSIMKREDFIKGDILGMKLDFLLILNIIKLFRLFLYINAIQITI